MSVVVSFYDPCGTYSGNLGEYWDQSRTKRLTPFGQFVSGNIMAAIVAMAADM